MRLLAEFQAQKQIYTLMGCSAQLAEILALITINKTTNYQTND